MLLRAAGALPASCCASEPWQRSSVEVGLALEEWAEREELPEEVITALEARNSLDNAVDSALCCCRCACSGCCVGVHGPVFSRCSADRRASLDDARLFCCDAASSNWLMMQPLAAMIAWLGCVADVGEAHIAAAVSVAIRRTCGECRTS